MTANGMHKVVIPVKLMTKRKKAVKSFIGAIEGQVIPTVALPFELQTAINDREQQRSIHPQQPQLQQFAGGRGNDQLNDKRNDQDNDQRGCNGTAWWKQRPAGEFPRWDLGNRKNPFGNDDEGRHNVEIIHNIKGPHHKRRKKKHDKDSWVPLCPKHLIGLKCHPNCKSAHLNKQTLEGTPEVVELKNEIGQALSRIYQ